MSDTNLEAANRVFDHPPAQPPYVSFFDIIELKGALGSRGSWKERLAVTLALWLASALTRDFTVRRLFCVALATEMRRANEWLDQQAPTPPNPPKK